MIETDRLMLRPIVASDVDDVHEIYGDEETARFAVAGVMTRPQCIEWIDKVMQRCATDGHGFLAAVLKTDGCYSGHAGLLRQEVDGRAELEIGYWFKRAYWGRGLASEAAAAFRDYAFEVMKRRRVISIIDPRNVASCRVAEKTGLALERRTRWRDREVCIYSLERAA